MSQSIIGEVVKESAAATVKVSVRRTRIHPIYRKRYTITKNYLVHDRDNVAKVGDKVRITAVPPISKRKRFMIDKVIEAAPVIRGEE